MGLSHSPKIVTNGLVLALDAANNKSYPRIGTVWSSGWAGSFSNPTYSFDGNLSTATIQNGTATYTFAGGGLSVSGTVRIYVTFGASSGQVAGLPNVIVVDGTDVSSKMAAANVYTTGVGAGWIDITSEVGSVFNTIVMTGTSNRSNPSIYAVEVDGQILIDAVAATSWTDLSGNGNTGTLTNGPTFSNVNGGSIVFDGTNDYVDTVNTGTTFQFANVTFTVSLWIKTSATSGVIISKGATASTAGWMFQFDSAGTVSGTTKGSDGTNTYNRSSTATVNNNTWRNIVAVYTTNTTTLGSNTTSIYIDGVLSNGTGTLGGLVYATTTDTIQIGRRPTGAYWSGSVSNIQIYNRELTASEVLRNYNAVKSRFGL
jgi:hypothetical protein